VDKWASQREYEIHGRLWNSQEAPQVGAGRLNVLPCAEIAFPYSAPLLSALSPSRGVRPCEQNEAQKRSARVATGKGPSWDTPARLDGLPAKNWITREESTLCAPFSVCGSGG
jgi:hypothetical protein